MLCSAHPEERCIGRSCKDLTNAALLTNGHLSAESNNFRLLPEMINDCGMAISRTSAEARDAHLLVVHIV